MIERSDRKGLREIKMDRAPANALHAALMGELREELISSANDGMEAIILTGRPGVFCSGFDVLHMVDLDRDQIRETGRSLHALLCAMATSPIPIVAAINGHSPGAGGVLTLYCDARIMANGPYRIGVNHVAVGLVPQSFVIGALGRLVGQRQAERMLLAGRLLTPLQAHTIGLVDELVEEETSAVDAARRWCEEHLALPRKPMLTARGRLRADLIALVTSAEAEAEDLSEMWFQPDAQKTVRDLVARLRAKKAAPKPL